MEHDSWFVDFDALRLALEHFQKNCISFWTSLGVEDPSHLKIFGHLLYSLTQLRDEQGERRDFLFCERVIRDTDEPSVEFLRVHFHEFACFTAVYNMFVSAQRQRREPLRFDYTRPPASARFTRSMVDYLREWGEGPLSGDRTPFDIYMIFKSMDLYGVEASPQMTPSE